MHFLANSVMKPKPSPIKDKQGHLLRIELGRIIHERHPIVRLAEAIDWDRLDEVFGKSLSMAKKRGIKLRQSYSRIAKKMFIMQSRYAGAGQMKRATKGVLGDCLNVILSAAGMNFHKLLRWRAALFRLVLLSLQSSKKPAYAG